MLPRTVTTVESFLFDNLKSNHKGEHQISSAALQLQLIRHGARWFRQSRFLGTEMRMESQCPLMVSTCWPLWFVGTMNICQLMALCFRQQGERTEDWQLPSTANWSCLPSSLPYSRMLPHATGTVVPLTHNCTSATGGAKVHLPQRKSEGLCYTAKCKNPFHWCHHKIIK